MYISADSSSTTKMLGLFGGQVMQTSNAAKSWFTPSFFQSSTVSGSSTAVNNDGTMMAVGTNGNGIYIGKISYSSGGGSSGAYILYESTFYHFSVLICIICVVVSMYV